MNRFLIIVTTILSVCALGLGIYSIIRGSGKTGYVYVESVYNGFNAKTKVEKELSVVENKQQAVLDSIKQIITQEQENLNAAKPSLKPGIQTKFDNDYQNYERLLNQFSEYNTKESQRQTDKLLKQINQYVKDFGEENGYDYIFGASGNGTLMYAKDKHDITQEVVKYINKKYAGE